MGIKLSRREACPAVRGNPSRMNEADGSGEGSVMEEVWESQFWERSLARMRRRIISSGTRLPRFMAASASSPARSGKVVRRGEGERGILEMRRQGPQNLRTKRRFVPHTLPQQIPRTDGRELWEALYEALRLRTFADARGPNENDAGRPFKLFGWHDLNDCCTRNCVTKHEK